MLGRSLLVLATIVFAVAICFGCSHEDCSYCSAGGGKPIEPPEPVTTVWQAASGLENAGACDRPEAFRGAFVLPNLIEATDNGDGTHTVTLPNGCSSLWEETEDGAVLASTTVCNDVFYQIGSATQTITSGSLMLRGEADDEADFSMSYTINQDLSAVGGPADSECEFSLLFVQLTQDDGLNPLETVATFARGDFIESVERDASGNTWVMKVAYVDTGEGDGLNGVYKIPDATGAKELISDYGHGFGGNIVFDEDERLFGTYSDSENTTPPVTRQVVEIDTETGARTVIADLPDDCSPNGITLDTLGNIYVADSIGGRVFRIPAGGGTAEVETWAEGGSLVPISPSAPGPNGLKIFDQHLYVSVSGSLMLIRIPINPDGSAGTAQQVSMGVIGDDFSLDVDGNTWMTTHPMNGVVLIRPDGTVRLMHDYLDEVWGPTSAVFGVAPGDDTTLYVVNDGNAYAATVFAAAPWFQQSSELFPATVQRVDVGVEGAAVPGEVILDVDTDGDGYVDSVDNCPLIPNGPDLGTCFGGDPGVTCQSNGECGVDEQCQMDQEDSDGDGIGDVCDDCPFDADNDIDEDGVCGDADNCPLIPNGPDLGTCFGVDAGATCQSNGDCGIDEQCQMDQEDSDGDGFGDVCDPCPDDPLNECGTGGPTLVPAALLSVASGCETYIGAHPVVPDHPTEVVEYVFCADGTAEKRWNPAPGEAIPGPSDGSGTWSYDGNTLTINTVAPGSFGTTTTVEVYGVAITYDDGGTQKLDWYAVAQTAPGDGSTIVGSYASDGGTQVNMPGIIDLDATVSRDLEVSAGDPAPWAQTEIQEVTCTGLGCSSVETGTIINETSGTIPQPGVLYQVGSTYYIQTDDTLVLEKQ